MVRYVHLPGNAVDTALLEDGRLHPNTPFLQLLMEQNSDQERSCEHGRESKMKPMRTTGLYEVIGLELDVSRRGCDAQTYYAKTALA